MRSICLALAAAVLLSIAAGAQKPTQTPAEFFLAYRAAWARFASFDDYLPYYSEGERARLAKEFKVAPPEVVKQLFENARKEALGAADIKVVKSERLGFRGKEEYWELEVAFVKPDRSPGTGTIQIISERGAWKLEAEFYR